MMIKSLRSASVGEKEKFSKPSSIQKSIPIKRMYRDNIWEVGGKFSKTWKFTDINYAVASPADQLAMFLDYCALLNALPTDATAKISIVNRKLSPAEFEKSTLIKQEKDALNKYRLEYNTMLADKAAESNNITQDKYLTISAVKKGVQEARTFFARVGADLITSFGKLGSAIKEQNNFQRLRIFHDFYCAEESADYLTEKSLQQTIKKGHDFKDFIAPSSLAFKADHFDVSGKYGRVLFLKEYAAYIKDTMISELTDMSKNMIISIDVLPIPTDEAVKEMQRRIMAVETDITRWQQKQNSQNNFSSIIPYDMELTRKETHEFMDDLTTRDQRMMFGLVTLVHQADNFAELKEDTETIMSICGKHGCQMANLRYQQEDGLNTVLPYGLRRIDALRTLTTESTAVLMPFKTQEILDKGGIYYGVNAISHNLIICNRKELINGNGFILGVSGSGKSFAAKEEIASILLATNDDVIIVDVEREYVALVDAMQGQSIHISSSTSNFINAMAMSEDYGEGENPLGVKAEFILTLCQNVIGSDRVGAKEKSIIDRCVANVYRRYVKNFQGPEPTLNDLYDDLMRQKEPAAHDIALGLELFTKGSLNIFAQQTNVNIKNRLLRFDILDIGEQLKTTGMLVMLESILNRVIENRRRNKRTHIFLDEVHIFFKHEYSSQFLDSAWRRFRKYNAEATGMTQMVETCLSSETGKVMLGNSEFLLLFNQAATDRENLASLLKISQAQLSYITNAKSGHGLIKVGGDIVPFVNDFPTDTMLYRLMTSKPGETA